MNVGTITKEDLLKEVADLKAKVSSLEETERELTKAKEFSKSVINSLPGVFYVIDNKGRVLIWNKNFEQAFGYSGQEIAKMHATDLFCEDEKWDMTDTMVRAFTKGDAKLEATAITKSGEQLPYYFTGKNATIDNEHYLLGMGIDVSKRKGIEHELEAAKDWYHALFESANDAVFVYKRPPQNERPGCHLDVNEVACSRMGYTKEEMLNLTPAEMIAPERRELTPQLQNRKKEENIVYETTHITKTGQRIDVENSSHLFEFKGEQIIIVVSRDITERKRVEKELEKQHKQLEDMVQNLNRTNTQLTAANKELEAFNYSVSHDLRSPLRSVDGFSQALLEDYSKVLDDNGKNYLERVRKASQRMGRLIDDLLSLSRLTRGEMKHETVDISAIAEEIVEELKLHDPKRKVEFIIAKDITAEADARMLRVALNNLLGNAWKFTGKTAEAVIEFGVTDDADGNRTYYVKDNGVGFNMEYSGKLFGAFQRLCGMNEFPGNGIGLATVQRVINRHGGGIWAEVEEDKGATFYFTI